MGLFNPKPVHVRISDKGRKILDNYELASKVADAVCKNGRQLHKGINVEGLLIKSVISSARNNK